MRNSQVAPDVFDPVVNTAADPEEAGDPGPAQAAAPQGGNAARFTRTASALVRTAWFVPALITALLCTWRASSIEIWLDELTSVNVASRSWSQILNTLTHVDAVHGAYYLFLHLWMAVVGTSLFGMRLPGIAAMVGAVVCVAATGQRLFGKRAGFAAGIFFALTPAIARYATELRSYPFVALAAALASLLLVRAVEQPSRRRWAGYTAALVMAGLFNLISLTIVIGHAVGLAAYLWRSEDRPWLTVRRFAASLVVAGAGVSPVIYYGAREGNPQPRPTVHDLFAMGPEAVCSVLGAGVLLAFGAAAWGNPRHRQVALASATAALPLPCIWLISRYVGDSSFFYFARYLLFCVPAWAVLAGAGVTAGRSLRALPAMLLVFAIAVVPGQNQVHTTYAHSWFNYPDLAFPQRDYRGAARIVQHAYHQGDAAIIYGMTDIDEGVNFYLPADMQLRNLMVVNTAAQIDNIVPKFCTDFSACLSRPAPRAWLILPGHPAKPFGGLPPAEVRAIQSVYSVAYAKQVRGMTISLLVQK